MCRTMLDQPKSQTFENLILFSLKVRKKFRNKIKSSEICEPIFSLYSSANFEKSHSTQN